MSAESVKTYPPLPSTVRGKAFFLDVDPKGEKLLYWNDRSVYIRNIKNPADVDIYTQHSYEVTCAKYAPSGFYIASGDVSGKLRIWDTTQAEHILKYEYQPIAGPIKDIVWSPDSKRIALVGEGKEQHAAVIMWDTGTTVGGLPGNSNRVNSVDYRPVRPFRIATGSDDHTVRFYEGPPFKPSGAVKNINKMVNVVRFAPDGSVFIAGTSSGQIFVYDGKTGEEQGSLGGGKSHTGGIYGLSFSRDGKKALSVSGDKTAKIWNMETKEEETMFEMGKQLEDMQLSCIWKGEECLTVCLSGEIKYLDQENPSTPSRIIKGHQKNIQAIVISEDKSTIFSACFTGRVCHWNVESGEADYVNGNGHNSSVTAMALMGNKIYSVGIDDTLRIINVDSKEYDSVSVSLTAQATSVAQSTNGLTAVTTVEQAINLYRGEKLCFSHKLDYQPTCCDFHVGNTEIVIGGEEHLKVYTIDNDTLKEKCELDFAGVASSVRYSPDGAFLVAGGSRKAIYLYSTQDYKPKIAGMVYHLAKITDIAWSPDSKRFASCDISAIILIWSVDDERNRIKVKNPHQTYPLFALGWLDNDRLISAGGNHLKQWVVKS